MNNFVETQDIVTNNLSDAEVKLKNISTNLNTLIAKALKGDLSYKILSDVVDNFYSVNSNVTFVIDKFK